MDLVTGAIGIIAPKLFELIKSEYIRQHGVSKEARVLLWELESIHAALSKVGEVPPEQLDEQVRTWARQVREASYDMEDILDIFLVHVDSHKPADVNKLGEAMRKIRDLFCEVRFRHDIAGAMQDINKQLEMVAERRARYKVDEIVAKAPATTWTIDPRVAFMYREVTQLVAIDKSTDDFISMLQGEAVPTGTTTKKVSIVGIGGLGKTTLAKVSRDKLKSLYDCTAFVSVGRNPDFVKVFKDILFDLDKTRYENIHNDGRGVELLIRELREFLKNKRYFVVIDDIWELRSWERIKLAIVENNCASRIITTTRKFEVAKEAGEVYKLQPLSYDNSKRLFYMRLFGGENKCPKNHPVEASNAILKKCGGVPLAIITMASFLLGKSIDEWLEVCNSPGFFRGKNDRNMENTMHILSLSYYDLPSHLKTCMVYLSVFPEDCVIEKDSLISKWIEEGFVEKKPGRGLFEIGEEYLHDLINRNMIQLEEVEDMDYQLYGHVHGCRVHDMVLDLIISKSHDQNFVSDNCTLSENNARRLAPKKRTLDLKQGIHKDIPQLRSFIAWGCDIDKWALHPRLKLIRVLALEHCRLREGCHSLQHLGNLLHLRYLGIRYTRIDRLPEEIRALKLLRTLDLKQTGIEELPLGIGFLKQLVCLRACGVRAPEGIIGKLTSLEELQILPPEDNNGKSTREFVKGLGNLRELRMLRTSIQGMDDGMQLELLQSLSNMHKLQHLALGSYCDLDSDMTRAWDAAVLQSHLQHLHLAYICFSSLPSCINASHLSKLCYLAIHVQSMDEQGLKMLGGLHELRHLILYTWSTATMTNVAADGCFRKLKSCSLRNSMVLFVSNGDSSVSFTIGYLEDTMAIDSKKNDDNYAATKAIIMPSLEALEFTMDVKRLRLMQNNGSSDILGLAFLSSLQKVKVNFWCWGALADDLEKAEVALRRAIDIHPNRPMLQVLFSGKDQMERRSVNDDGVCNSYPLAASPLSSPATLPLHLAPSTPPTPDNGVGHAATHLQEHENDDDWASGSAMKHWANTLLGFCSGLWTCRRR